MPLLCQLLFHYISLSVFYLLIYFFNTFDIFNFTICSYAAMSGEFPLHQSSILVRSHFRNLLKYLRHY